MIFKHIKAGYTLDRLKFSANEQNSSYFFGNNPTKTLIGAPDVMYDELVFCKERRIIYTHGAFYENAVDGFLRQIDNLRMYSSRAVEGEIVEYVGETDEDYVNGYIYKYIVSDHSVPVRRILTSTNTGLISEGDKYSFVEDIYDTFAYVDSARYYYCFENPTVIGTKVYKIGNPVTEYKVTSYLSSSTEVQVALESLIDQTTIVISLKKVSKELWTNSGERQVYASAGKSFSGIVQVNGNTYVYITSEFVEDRSNYWKLIIPDSSASGGFKKVIVGNSEINALDHDTITFNSGTGIELENTSRGIIISRLTEIKDDLTNSNYTWSSEKISSVINSINTNNFIVVDQLPETDIDTNVIYIVPKIDATTTDQKDEYIYVNGQWELVGTMKVNMEDYYTKEEVDDLLSEKQNTLTAIGKLSIVDDIISVDLTAYYTKEEVDNLLRLKQDKISGSEGEVAYLSTNGIISQTIMSDGYVVDTEEDLETCKNNSPSFETVFSTWKRFSHKDGTDDYQKNVNNSDYNSWAYIPSLDTVSQPNNSSAYTGFISPKSYTNYDITVRVYSDNTDDDFIGMVAAFAKDSNGKEHTLSFLRTTYGTGINFTDCGWVCLLDFRAQSSKTQIGVNGLQILANKNNSLSVRNTTWAGINQNGASNGGTVINMTRSGNVITARCSEFGTTDLVEGSLITIDLNDDTLTTRYPVLNLFKGSAPWGYSTYSQSNSRYQNISITDPSNMMLDLVHDKVLLYSTTTRSWEERVDYTPIKTMGVGRFNYNSITDKLFYNDGIRINRISTELTPGKNIDITDEGVISANISASSYDIKDLADSTNLRQTWSNKQDTISGEGVISVENNVVKADLSDYYNKETVDNKLDTKQNLISGNSGEVLYHNGSDVFTQEVLGENLVVTTQTDLDKCKNISPSFKTVFDTWQRFSHLNGVNNAKPADLSGWEYLNDINTVRQNNNSESYAGFISPKSYSNYELTIRVFSDDTVVNDDDSIGLVAAFAKDSNGREHTLSFIRSIGTSSGSTGKTSIRWVCVLDYCAFALDSKANGQTILANKSTAVPTASGVAKWADVPTGSVIYVKREGNVFTAKCSNFNSRTLVEESTMTINLDTLTENGQNPTLNLFKGSSPWGYSTFSQAHSMYENISVVDPSFVIFDLVNSAVLTFDSATSSWIPVAGQNPIELLGAGRFSYNNVTNKLFYNNGTSVVELASKYHAGNNIKIEDDTISAVISSEDIDVDLSDYYNKSEINTKFNSLATVASTGSYNDLTNKPQLQNLTAGENIEINDSVISAVDTKYTAGDGIEIDENNNISLVQEEKITEKPAEDDQEVNVFYNYNGVKVVVPRGNGYFNLFNNYVVPDSEGNQLFPRGLYVQDDTRSVTDTEANIYELWVGINKSSYTLEFNEDLVADVIDAGLAASQAEAQNRIKNALDMYYTNSCFSNSIDAKIYYNNLFNTLSGVEFLPQLLRIPLGSRVFDVGYYYGSYHEEMPANLRVIRKGDYFYDLLGNLYYVSSASFTGSSGSLYVSFSGILSKRTTDSFSITLKEISSVISNNISNIINGYVGREIVKVKFPTTVSAKASIEEFSYKYADDPATSRAPYRARLPFKGFYKNSNDQYCYVYGPSESETINIAMTKRVTQLQNKTSDSERSKQPTLTFCGFLTFGTPYSIELPIQYTTDDSEIQGFSWTNKGTSIDDVLSDTSINAVQNKVITNEITNIRTEFVPHYTEFPTEDVEEGIIAQYIGENSSTYTNGYFYKSVKVPGDWVVFNETNPFTISEDLPHVSAGDYIIEKIGTSTFEVPDSTNVPLRYGYSLNSEYKSNVYETYKPEFEVSSLWVNFDYLFFGDDIGSTALKVTSGYNDLTSQEIVSVVRKETLPNSGIPHVILRDKDYTTGEESESIIDPNNDSSSWNDGYLLTMSNGDIVYSNLRSSRRLGIYTNHSADNLDDLLYYGYAVEVGTDIQAELIYHYLIVGGYIGNTFYPERLVEVTQRRSYRNKDTYTWSQIDVQPNSGGGVISYNDLTDKPTIPTKTSQLTNDSGFSTFSGSYNDLTDKPTIPQVDDALSDSSSNTVENRVIKSAIDDKITNGGGVTTEIALTKAEYNNIPTKDDNTVYIITDEPVDGSNVFKVCVVGQNTTNISDLVQPYSLIPNNVVILTDLDDNKTYEYMLNNTTKTFKGNSEYDLMFRYIGNNEFKPIVFGIL